VQRDQRVLDGIIENIGIGPLRPRDAADHGHAVAQHQLIGARSPAWATAIARVRRSSIAARSAANSLLVRRTRHAIAILPRADAKQQSHAFQSSGAIAALSRRQAQPFVLSCGHRPKTPTDRRSCCLQRCR
jgi:hypothetical protein